MNKMKFSIIMSVYNNWNLTCHAIDSVINQSYKNWELIIVTDGDPPHGFNPKSIVGSIFIYKPDLYDKIKVIDFKSDGKFGNLTRYEGLKHCTGDYTIWCNHDNLLDRDYLHTHLENIEEEKECISIIPIRHWSNHRRYCGVLPFKIESGGLDLLNLALPTHRAKEIQAFNNDIYNADWLIVEDLMKLNIPVKQFKSTNSFGAHF